MNALFNLGFESTRAQDSTTSLSVTLYDGGVYKGREGKYEGFHS